MWHRQAYTLTDLLGICEETANCECVFTSEEGNSKNTKVWSMHRGTDLADENTHAPCQADSCNTFSLTRTSDPVTNDPDIGLLPQMLAQPSETVTYECQLDEQSGSGRLVETKRESAGVGGCIP